MPGIPVLIYHALEDESHPAGASEPGEQLYVLSVNNFRKQMEYLQQGGYRTFLLEELARLDTWPEKSVVLTFDDGHESNFLLALPILQKYGYKADFFITTGWIGTPHFMNCEHIKALSDAGMGIGTHGETHAFLSDLPKADTRKELENSRNTLVEILKRPVDSFSAPGGRINGRVFEQALNCGYRTICTSHPGLMTANNPFTNIPRFAMRATDTLASYSLILSQDPKFLRSIVRRNSMLRFAKRLLGNNCYQKLRGMLISG
jgi:peptidoglycan/xylan/chitin deacetylase (PgdA/CDA1 family)